MARTAKAARPRTAWWIADRIRERWRRINFPRPSAAGCALGGAPDVPVRPGLRRLRRSRLPITRPDGKSRQTPDAPPAVAPQAVPRRQTTTLGRPGCKSVKDSGGDRSGPLRRKQDMPRAAGRAAAVAGRGALVLLASRTATGVSGKPASSRSQPCQPRGHLHGRPALTGNRAGCAGGVGRDDNSAGLQRIFSPVRIRRAAAMVSSEAARDFRRGPGFAQSPYTMRDKAPLDSAATFTED